MTAIMLIIIVTAYIAIGLVAARIAYKYELTDGIRDSNIEIGIWVSLWPCYVLLGLLVCIAWGEIWLVKSLGNAAHKVITYEPKKKIESTNAPDYESIRNLEIELGIRDKVCTCDSPDADIDDCPLKPKHVHVYDVFDGNSWGIKHCACGYPEYRQNKISSYESTGETEKVVRGPHIHVYFSYPKTNIWRCECGDIIDCYEKDWIYSDE